MATFNRVMDPSGKEVVRCFVKGAAPAVMALASTALSKAPASPGHTLRQGAEQNGADAWERPACGSWPEPSVTSSRDFDPNGDLLAFVDALEMTSLVGMVDPPREESKAAVAQAQAAHIGVRMVTGDDVITGAAIAKQLDIAGEAILGADFAALSEQERLERIDHIGVVGRVAPEHKVLLARDTQEEGRRRGHDR